MTHFSEIRTARKRHVPGTRTGGCDCCLRTIEPGQIYERFSATPGDEIWSSDRWSHMKAHSPYGSCTALRDGAS
jgi:hypothetical protein